VGEHYWGETPEALLRASNAFGGGVAGCHDELCGVLSGAVLMIGARYGRTSSDESDECLYAFLREYRERFAQFAGGTRCEDVRSRLPEVEKRCLPVVEEGTRLLMEMLETWDKGAF